MEGRDRAPWIALAVVVSTVLYIACAAEPPARTLDICLAVTDCPTTEYTCVNGFCVPPGEDPVEIGVFDMDAGRLARDDAGELVRLEDSGPEIRDSGTDAPMSGAP
ncbi:MAG: hypothetical protein R3B82_20015 [Sandaracinaceae bacterium]